MTDALDNTTEFTYDEMGRRLSRTNALGKTETWTYHDDGQLASYTDPLVDGQGARTTSYAYDPDTGRLVEETDPSGRSTTYGYNAAGQLTEQVDSMPDGAGGVVDNAVTRVFDPESGRLTSVTDASGTTSYAYNSAGDLVETVAADGRRTAYDYDQAGRRSSITHPDGTVLDYGYDPVTGRLASITPRWSLADTFTGVDGGSPTGNRWSTTGSGSAALEGNRLRLEPAASGVLALRPEVPDAADSEVAFSYEVPDDAADGAKLRAVLRHSVTEECGPLGLNCQDVRREYRVVIDSDSDSVTVIKDAPDSAGALGSTPRPVGAAQERIRVRVSGSQLQVKVWDAAEAEPASWGIDITDTDVTGGAAPFIDTLTTDGAPTVWVDDVTYLDLGTPPAPAVTYDWDLNDRVVGETTEEGTRSWDYDQGRLAGYDLDLPGGGTPAEATFAYTGTEEAWVVPDGVTEVSVDMTGGDGGADSYSPDNHHALGGRLQATVPVVPGEVLHLGVGRSGHDASGASSPGAGAFDGATGGTDGLLAAAGGGGGASYLTKDGNRILVAGGGGGEGTSGSAGVHHGGAVLDDQTTAPSTAEEPAGSGKGGAGGGWRGGTQGADNGDSGGGGTNMADTTVASDVSSTGGYRDGNGYITLTWTDHGDDQSTTISYDSSGRVSSETTNDLTTTYTYDPAGQLLSASRPGDLRTWTYDDLGRWASASRPDGTFTYHYDDANQLTAADCTAGPCADTTYTDPLDGVNGTPTITNPYHYTNNNPVNLTDPLGLQLGDDTLEVDTDGLRECASLSGLEAGSRSAGLFERSRTKHVLAYSDRIQYWAKENGISPFLLAVLVHHEGGNYLDPFRRGVAQELDGAKLLAAQVRGGSPSVGIAGIQVGRATSVLDGVYCTNWPTPLLGLTLTFQDDFSLAIAAGYLRLLQDEYPTAGDGALFLAYANSEQTNRILEHVHWDVAQFDHIRSGGVAVNVDGDTLRMSQGTLEVVRRRYQHWLSSSAAFMAGR